MGRIAWGFVVLLGPAWSAGAQPSGKVTTERPLWDFNVSGGLFNGRPGENDTAYDDDWNQSGRLATSIGYYWTENLIAVRSGRPPSVLPVARDGSRTRRRLTVRGLSRASAERVRA